MKTTIGWGDFTNAFEAMRPDNFSYEGLSVLYDYLLQFEVDTGEELELDVIALCCDYSEDTWQDIARIYSIDLSECGQVEEAKREAVHDYLIEKTHLVGETSTGFIYLAF